MDLQKLYSIQKNLDDRILKLHNPQATPLLPKKLLALQVELGELANETRCFKYWSEKVPSNSGVILEEYVDCLHFILSIGLEKDFSNVTLDFKHVDTSLTDQFLNLYIDVNDFIIFSSRDHYITLFEDFISLGLSLNFTSEIIEEGYLRKNFINHNRQTVGY